MTPPLPARAIAKVFLSYRRDDSADVTGRIYDRLVHHFGKDQVFKDVDSIPIGVDFRRHLEKVVSDCETLLVVIGDRWLTAQHPARGARLNDTNDFVRIEIEIGLRRDIRVVPILVKGAQMPLESDLPDSIKELAYRNAIAVRVDPDFHNDMDRLISGLIEEKLAANQRTGASAEPMDHPAGSTSSRRLATGGAVNSSLPLQVKESLTELDAIIREAEIDRNIASVQSRFLRWKERTVRAIKGSFGDARAAKFSSITAPDFITGAQPRLISEARQCRNHLTSLRGLSDENH